MKKIHFLIPQIPQSGVRVYDISHKWNSHIRKVLESRCIMVKRLHVMGFVNFIIKSMDLNLGLLHLVFFR